MLTEEFKNLVLKTHLQSYADADLCDLSYGTSLAWEFANIYQQAPKYFSYNSSTANNEIEPYAHKEQYDANKSFIAIKHKFEGDYIQLGDVLYFEDCIVNNEHIIFVGDSIPERLKECLVEEEVKQHFLYASMGNGGFTTRVFPVKSVEEDIMDNYNEDIPNDKFKEFIDMDKSGIAIMHGIPGTGKSFYIRYLISQYPDKSFIWFDQSLLTQATSDAFVQFIISHKDSILILEDCEILIRTRNEGQNGLLNTVLNIADGIIGDSLRIKFICTFNTDITNVDKALLRKGRLKIKYEFKKLTFDKVQNLFNKFNIKASPKEMPLCDIYNYDEVNGGEDKRAKIGF